MTAEMQNRLPVSQIARLTGVSRGTVGYWIRSKKLCAWKTGKSYEVPVGELLFFLKSSGKKIPEGLAPSNSNQPYFRSFLMCWEYWRGSNSKHQCQFCPVFYNQLDACFTLAEGNVFCSSEKCADCQYYLDIYYPKLQFIEQLERPAIVAKDLYVWAVNRKQSEFFGLTPKEMLGMGIERMLDSASIEMVIAYAKRRRFDDSGVPSHFHAYLKGESNRRVKVYFSVAPLNQPMNAFLVIGDPDFSCM